jgi:hypothetical protein
MPRSGRPSSSRCFCSSTSTRISPTMSTSPRHPHEIVGGLRTERAAAERDAVRGRTGHGEDPIKGGGRCRGFVRYSGGLEARVTRNFPSTDLLDESHGLLPLLKGRRLRYHLEERFKLHGMVLGEFRKHSSAYLRWTDETPETWDTLGLDRKARIQKSVHECPG